MKKTCLSFLLCLATLLLLTTLAYSTELQFPNPSDEDPSVSAAPTLSVTPAQFDGHRESSFVNLVLNLVETDVEYSLDDSTALVLACNPFAEQQTDARISRPTSNLSVSLRISF